MAGGDSDAINERLNGLVNLLQVVGIDGVDTDVLVEEQKRVSSTKANGSSNKSSVARKNASSDMTARTAASSASSDAQILEIIRKLQQAQADSPEILEALKNPELLALASLAAQKQLNQSSQVQNKEKKSLATSLGDVIDVDDDNYPKIGPGYSDDISVVSDMTMPTVMTRQRVADEEYYCEVKGGQEFIPPMHGSRGSGPSPSVRRTSRTSRSSAIGTAGGGKTKNMVGQVRPMTSARRAIPTKTGGGGAAAQRRQNYQMAMNKLQSTGFGKQKPPDDRNIDRRNNELDRTLLSPTKKQTEFFQLSSPAKSAHSNNHKENSNNIGSATGGKTRKSKSKSVNGKSTTPSTTATSGTKSVGSSGGNSGGGKRKTSSSNKINNNSNNNDTKIDWSMSDLNGWPTFDEGNTKNNNKDVLVDNDGFFSDDVFSSNDGFDGPPTTTPRRKSKKKTSSRDNGTGSTRRTHRVKKDKDNDHLSSDNTKKTQEKEKSGNRRKSRRPSQVM
mmetsp:Transcript_8800/g.9374  ORF Transcript_8800/g.9374 Transcript_8800/m.9374 type:complete len:502 (+) Transcript_8800:44-1549(+)